MDYSSDSKDSGFRLPSKKQKELLDVATARYAESVESVAPFLTARGISPEAARAWRLGYVAQPISGHDQYRGKLAIPYLTPAGTVDMRFRCIENHEHKKENGCSGKYLSTAGAKDKVFGVWNFRRTATRGETVIAVCEGELDAVVSTSLADVPAVAISGATKWKPWWSACLDAYDDVVVPIDGDDAGRAFGRLVTRYVHTARVVDLAPGEDVNSFILRFGVDEYRKKVFDIE